MDWLKCAGVTVDYAPLPKKLTSGNWFGFVVTELKNLMRGYQNTKNKSNSNIFDEIQQKNHDGKAEP